MTASADKPRPVPVLIAVAGLVLITAAVFRPVSGHDFIIFDDGAYITGNPAVRGGLTREGVLWAFTDTSLANWHPLTWLSHMLDVQLFGLNPGAHHLVSLVLHAVSAILLLFLFWSMTGALWRSALTAALFAVHPLHVESVAWAAERKDVLSGLFFMLTLGAYLRYLRRPGAGRYFLTALCLALGLMAKPMLVTVPFLLLLLDGWPLGRWPGLAGRGSGRPRQPGRPGAGGAEKPLRASPGGLILEKVPLLILAAASSAATYAAQAGGGAVTSLEDIPFGSRAANALVSGTAYLLKTVWPSGLAIYYPYPIHGIPAWRWVPSLAFLAAVTVLALRLMRRVPSLATGWFWYLGMLVPVIGLVQVAAQAMADRYTYLPLIGIFMAAAWALPPERLASGRLVLFAAALCLMVLAALALVSRVQVGLWRNDLILFDHAVRVIPGNSLAHLNLGKALVEHGRVEEGLEHYREALRINSGNAGAHYTVGNILTRNGRPDEAIPYYEKAVSLRPEYVLARFSLGLALLRRGDDEGAIRQLREAVRLKPDFAEGHYQLGLALALRDRNEEAAQHLSRAVSLKPAFAEAHYNLWVVLIRLGREEEAEAHYLEAVWLKPSLAAGQP